jgi:redox-sensitive bicupin YhaK (pirin superfamily)
VTVHEPAGATHRARPVVQTVPATTVREGAGFVVHRPFPTPALPDFDPFLLLDEMGPTTYGPGEALGAPDHPHRGFETVTYMLDGAFEHADSAGHAGRIGPGDVQWMTAGAGVVHSEMPAAEIRRSGGRVHGVQLWVNLPRARKMVAPRYQEIPAAEIPSVRSDGATVRVIAGTFAGLAGPVATHTPVTVAHVRLEPGAELVAELDPAQRCCTYALGGPRVLVVHGDGDRLRLTGEGPADLLVLAGVPLREPVARYGPFVMSTREELVAAVEDYRAGRFGVIGA